MPGDPLVDLIHSRTWIPAGCIRELLDAQAAVAEERGGGLVPQDPGAATAQARQEVRWLCGRLGRPIVPVVVVLLGAAAYRRELELFRPEIFEEYVAAVLDELQVCIAARTLAGLRYRPGPPWEA